MDEQPAGQFVDPFQQYVQTIIPDNFRNKILIIVATLTWAV